MNYNVAQTSNESELIEERNVLANRFANPCLRYMAQKVVARAASHSFHDISTIPTFLQRYGDERGNLLKGVVEPEAAYAALKAGQYEPTKRFLELDISANRTARARLEGERQRWNDPACFAIALEAYEAQSEALLALQADIHQYERNGANPILPPDYQQYVTMDQAEQAAQA